MEDEEFTFPNGHLADDVPEIYRGKEWYAHRQLKAFKMITDEVIRLREAISKLAIIINEK